MSNGIPKTFTLLSQPSNLDRKQNKKQSGCQQQKCQHGQDYHSLAAATTTNTTKLADMSNSAGRGGVAC